MCVEEKWEKGKNGPFGTGKKGNGKKILRKT